MVTFHRYILLLSKPNFRNISPQTEAQLDWLTLCVNICMFIATKNNSLTRTGVNPHGIHLSSWGKPAKRMICMKWLKKMSTWRWKSYLKTLFSSGDWLQRERSRPVSENSNQPVNIWWKKTSVLTESGLPASSAPLFVTGNLATL